ncbi:unnamed protein product [Clonostachys chloroleuca]|uniref:Uncharacterized protein n=1 Tax=Clonostachys chloroleuca TaxID=1926264 RepID=A0AA35LSS2_9HYPO|nr:unnamed protein product [Clonostachys chloroleuca]
MPRDWYEKDVISFLFLVAAHIVEEDFHWPMILESGAPILCREPGSKVRPGVARDSSTSIFRAEEGSSWADVQRKAGAQRFAEHVGIKCDSPVRVIGFGNGEQIGQLRGALKVLSDVPLLHLCPGLESTTVSAEEPSSSKKLLYILLDDVQRHQISYQVVGYYE